jgi:hypothetical protein
LGVVAALEGVDIAEAGVAEVAPPLRMFVRRWETAFGVQSVVRVLAWVKR